MNAQETVEHSNINVPFNADFEAIPADCDASLVAQAKSGSAEAFGELYERHRVKTYRVAFRVLRNEHDAEDTVQRSFQLAFTNLRRFQGASAFSTWVTRIVINEALMMIRKRRTSHRHFVDSDDRGAADTVAEVPDAGPSPEEVFCERERRAVLLEAVGKLRRTLRIIVHHRELQGLTNAETARLLGLTVSAVKARTFHARISLRKHVQRKFAKPGPSFRLKKACAGK
jgi:RNA polymerase sigma-70 factor, ECF subfamily